ncbi:MAG: glycoside hydrolase family 9 protein [Ruminococcus sp.]|nr:glycoside hydrolase family 9 protein [Ruminococcus sp.]
MKKQGKKNRIFAGIAAAVMAVSATAVGVRSYSANAADLELDNYAKLLQYSLYFYDANMCGDKVGETSAFSWRDNCHTGDVALGGFHDAGDAIKCGQTAGFTASTLGWAYYEYKDQFQKTGTTAHFKVISDEFNEFFKNCTTLSGDTVTSFIYEVGDDGSDHGKWFAPEAMWDHGSSETYSTTDGASDIAAQYAASLAQSYLNFGNEEDLKYAVALYNFADKYRTITYDQNTYGGAAKDVQDDISWAAGWLYLATGEEPYLTENSKYTQVQNDWTQDYCYANSQLGAAIINAEITGNWSFATNYIGQKVNANQNQFYVMNSWGSARYDVLMQFCALVTSKYEQSGVDYTEWAKKQMNYILGDNNANVCLVVGYNHVSATSPHHRAASNLKVSDDWHEWGAWDGKYASSNGHVLYGALVGGPTSSDFTTYKDDARDATSNEVAIDYQVGLVAAAAGLYDKYQTGSVVAQIGDEVTVYPDEVAFANGGEVKTNTTT